MKANRTRRRFSPCCVAAAALLMMGSDIMRGLVQEEQEKLFGLLKTPARNAEIHYRDTSDWGRNTRFTPLTMWQSLILTQAAELKPALDFTYPKPNSRWPGHPMNRRAAETGNTWRKRFMRSPLGQIVINMPMGSDLEFCFAEGRLCA